LNNCKNKLFKSSNYFFGFKIISPKEILSSGIIILSKKDLLTKVMDFIATLFSDEIL